MKKIPHQQENTKSYVYTKNSLIMTGLKKKEKS